MSRTIQVEHNGQQITVNLPDDVLTREEVERDFQPKEAFENALQARTRIAMKGMVNADEFTKGLMEDENFLAQVADTKPDFFKQRLGVPEASDDVEKIRADLMKQLMEKEVRPRDEKIQILEGRVGNLLKTQLDADVATAAGRLGVHPEQIELLQSWYKPRAQYSEEHDKWFIKEEGGDGFALNPDPESKVPYRTIEADLAQLRTEGKHSSWFQKEPRQGSDYKGPGGEQGDKTYAEQIAEARQKGDMGEVQRLQVAQAREASKKG